MTSPAFSQQGLPPPQSPLWVAEQFVKRYYEILEKHPQYIHRFYKDDSSFSVVDMLDPSSANNGIMHDSIQAIQDKVMETIQGVLVNRDHLDAQFSLGGGVLLRVTGTMLIKGARRKFIHTFFLATQEKGYYVLNEMLRLFPTDDALYTQAKAYENGYAAEIPAVVQEPSSAAGYVQPDEPVQNFSEAVPSVEPAAVPEPHVEPAPVHESIIPVAVEPAFVEEKVRQLSTSSPAVVPETEHPAKVAASPAPTANLTYAQRVKQSIKAPQPAAARPEGRAPETKAPPPAAPSPAPAAPKPVIEAPISQPPRDNHVSDSYSHPISAPVEKVEGVFVKRLPAEATAEMLVEVFSKFGKLKNGADGVIISGKGSRTAKVKFEDKASKDAALQAGKQGEVVLEGVTLVVDEIWQDLHSGPPMRGHGGRGRAPPGAPFRQGRGGPEGGRGSWIGRGMGPDSGERRGRGRGDPRGRGPRPQSGEGGHAASSAEPQVVDGAQ